MEYIMRFNIKPDKNEEFQRWIQANEADIRDNNPEGWRYLGFWFTVRGLGRYDGEMRWELEDYNALGAGFGSQKSQSLILQLFEFLEGSRVIETSLMKSAHEIEILPGR
jgi:hypothetical protein